MRFDAMTRLAFDFRPMLRLESVVIQHGVIGPLHRTDRLCIARPSDDFLAMLDRRRLPAFKRWAWVFRLVTDTYTTAGSNTWTCPAGVTSAQGEVWGAGGSPPSTNGTVFGGGGGGAYSLKSGIAVTPSTGYTAFVGNYVTGNAGQDSYFIDASTCMAKGGGAPSGTGGSGGGVAANGVGDTKYSGGSGGNGVGGRDGGGGGSSAGTGANGNTGNNGDGVFGGAGATAPTGGGDGGKGGATSPASGTAANGAQPGGGGGGRGRGNTQSSGVGGVGKVSITYTVTAAGFYLAMIG